MNDLIVYTTEDGRSQLKLRAQDRTFWLTELEMAAPFDTTKPDIFLHLRHISPATTKTISVAQKAQI